MAVTPIEGLAKTTTIRKPLISPRLELVLVNALLIALCAAVIFPVIYAVLVSVRPDKLGPTMAFSLDTWFFGHYTRLLSSDRFLRYILNSAINSIGGAALTTVCAAMAGYAFARFRFRGGNLMLGIVLGLMMLPGLTNLIPLYKLASDLEIRDTYFLMIITYAAYGIPFGIWVMKNFFESIPRELEEAAAVDGATPFQGFLRVVVPIAVPGLISVFLLNFVYNWNDFLTALLLLSSTEMKTATVGLFDFQNQLAGNESELLAASCVIIMLPGIALFLAARRAFFQSMVEGAVKG
ncbi:MAG: carbohydrate ABC transporter permease [Chloroflexaceae bacterium]|jgi:ABC-type glycerol-3-phosphate transport system permease component|nr:carbohydrate ABC transporter permease [Chloroflexaceae bacterium]